MKRIVTLAALACFSLPTVASFADTREMDKQIIGAWKLSMTTPEGEAREPIVLIGRNYDNYAAWYVGESGFETMKKVQLKDDLLVGTIQPKEYPGVTVTLKASLKGKDVCEGVGAFQSEDGDSGSWKFAGKRLALSMADDVTTWKVSFVTPDYEQHAATVSVFSKGDEYYAWYSGKDHELPAQKVVVKDSQVTLKISAETRDGMKVDLLFQGNVDGDSVKGSAKYQLDGETGSFPFTAKLAS